MRALLPCGEGESRGPLMIIPSDLGWCGFQFFPGRAAGERCWQASTTRQAARRFGRPGKGRAPGGAIRRLLAGTGRAHSVEPFLTGKETPTERNLVAACVNRVLRNARTGGNIGAPSMVEFFGPTWAGADMVWICFQPACRYALWIEPTLWANSLRTLLGPQTFEGMVPQFVGQKSIDPITQIPNISPVLRDYYVFTKDRRFLEDAYPRFKRWYAWFWPIATEAGWNHCRWGRDAEPLEFDLRIQGQRHRPGQAELRGHVHATDPNRRDRRAGRNGSTCRTSWPARPAWPRTWPFWPVSWA